LVSTRLCRLTFFLRVSVTYRDLHSFPTRRSSDLPYRHGGKENAEAFFLNGMTQAMHRLASQACHAFPVTIYYAFKQAETQSKAGDRKSTRLNSSHVKISYAVFCLKKKRKTMITRV